jgi:hypothetical protein
MDASDEGSLGYEQKGGADAQQPPPKWHFSYVEDRDGKLTFVSVRPVDEAEMARYRESVSLLLDRQADQSLQHVVANFAEFRAVLSKLALAVTTTTSTRALDYASAVHLLGHLLTNWLNSFRMFDDHTKARLTRRFGANSTELAIYEDARAVMFDSNPSYRFMSKLRDYAQHVGRVPLQVNMNATRTSMSMRVFMDRNQLLDTFSNWRRQVRSDLESGPSTIDVEPHVEGTMQGILQLAQVVRDIDATDIDKALSVIRETVQPLPDGDGQRPMFIRYHAAENQDGSMKAELYPAFVASKAEGPPESDEPQFDLSIGRPTFVREICRYSCQGAVDKIADLPSERCGEPATDMFMFAHRDGGAVVLGCPSHAIALGRWAGRRFGGCWGTEIAKLTATIEMAEASGFHISMPHKAEYSKLTPAPGAPRIVNPFA